MRRLTFIFGLVLSGCAGGGPVESGPSPEQMKAAVLAERRIYFKDPDSLQDARIGQPWGCLVWTACLCFEANGRNGFGGYTGMKQYVAMFSGSKVAGIRAGSFTDQCDSMSPFPEMNGSYAAPAPGPTPPLKKKS